VAFRRGREVRRDTRGRVGVRGVRLRRGEKRGAGRRM
jgi:hypothetical protein